MDFISFIAILIPVLIGAWLTLLIGRHNKKEAERKEEFKLLWQKVKSIESKLIEVDGNFNEHMAFIKGRESKQVGD